MANKLNLSGRVSFVIIFTIVTHNRDSQAEVLTMPDDHEDKIINEGESLSITCDYEGVNNINYPRDDPINGISTSMHEFTSERYYVENYTTWSTIKWTFHRKEVVFGDTGWYSCLDGRKITFYKYDVYVEPYFSAYYVYVKSNKNFFVQTNQNNTITANTEDDQLLIPCRPTSPDFHVDLINIQTNAKVILNEKNSYSPRFGFLIELFPDLNGNIFKCRIQNDSQISEIFYHVKIGNFVKKSPSIENKEDYQFAVIGETLHINCSFTIFKTNSVEAAWITPRSSRFTKFRQYEMTNTNFTNITLELVVENVTINDTGLYACQLNNMYYKKVDILYIEVGEAIEVTRMWEPITAHDNFKLRCNSWLGDSTKAIKWLKGTESISENERITVTTNIFNHTHFHLAKRADLNIKDIRESDKGSYYCAVTKYDDSVTVIHYNLTEIHEPKAPRFNDTNLNNNSVTLLKPIDKAQHLFCDIVGMPPPTITWYKNGKLFENTSRGDEDWNIRSSIYLFSFQQDISGKYSCVGANRYGQTDRRNIEIIVIAERITPSIVWITMIVSIMFIIIVLIIYTSCKISFQKAKSKALQEIGLVCSDETHLQTLHLNLNADEQIQHLPFSEKWEFSLKKVKLGKQLGKGEFGVVLKAEAQNILDEDSTSTVSVKLVSRKADRIHMKSIVHELKILLYVGKHLNLVNLVGVCTDKIVKNELLLILEYSCFGNISDYLMCHRKNFINEVNPRSGKIVPFLDHAVGPTSTSGDNIYHKSESENPSNLENVETSKNSTSGWRSKYSGDYSLNDVESIYSRDLLSWSFQIASAMDHLSAKKVVHGDLALENILLTRKNVIKLCDIGVARILLADDDYKQKHEQNLPLKWMAIESINQTRCSLQSDVWSFGVVLWELFTLSGIPYDNIPNEQLYEKLLSGYRLEKPPYAVQEIYAIMLECWQEDPNMRPTFVKLVHQTGALLDDDVREQIIRMSDSYAEKRVQFVSDENHLNRTSSLEFENAMALETDLNESGDYTFMETRL